MNPNIEQEVDRTLSYLDANDSIQPSDLFVDSLSGRLSGLRTRRGVGYRSRSFYPVVILLMAVLNAGAIFMSLAGHGQTNNSSVDQTSIIASEYGMGQSNAMAF